MSDTYSVLYSTEALSDLRGIYSYIAFTLRMPDTAQNQVNRIRKEVRSLDFMPGRHKIVDWEPWKSMHMHQFPVDNYSIFYLVDNEAMEVSIARIVYDGRDLPNVADSELHPVK